MFNDISDVIRFESFEIFSREWHWRAIACLLTCDSNVWWTFLWVRLSVVFFKRVLVSCLFRYYEFEVIFSDFDSCTEVHLLTVIRPKRRTHTHTNIEKWERATGRQLNRQREFNRPIEKHRRCAYLTFQWTRNTWNWCSWNCIWYCAL